MRAATLVLALCVSAVVASNPVSQIHLAISHDGGYYVSWATMAEANTNVSYGTSKSALTMSATGTMTTYSTHSIQRNTNNYTTYNSPFLHHTLLPSLKPKTTYYYQCGDAATGDMSAVLSFTTVPAPGDSSELVFSVVGDLGQTTDSQLTASKVSADPTSQMLFHVGDMSYADCDGGRWDSYFEMMEVLSSKTAWMVTAGNHEIEPDGTGNIMTGYKKRYRMPEAAPGVDNSKYFQNPDQDGWDCTPSAFTGDFNFGNSFYSFDVGMVHFIVLNSYVHTSPTSPQYKWLSQDLEAVDRTKTPWVIAGFHSPWYSSNSHHYDEFNTVAMRDSMEPLLHKYGVSIVFNGHVHAYQRSLPVYMNQTISDGTQYVVIGDGGNREGHATGYVAPTPAWSAYKDDMSFGHGRVVVHNATTATFEWHRNEDSEWTVADSSIVHNAPLARMLRAQA